jgi:hypothetical protein
MVEVLSVAHTHSSGYLFWGKVDTLLGDIFQHTRVAHIPMCAYTLIHMTTSCCYSAAILMVGYHRSIQS